MDKVGEEVMNRNLPLKLLCILIAFVLWLYVIGEENPLINYGYSNVPIQLNNEEYLDKSGLVLEDLSKTEVNVKVKARRNDILKLDSSKIKVSIDLRSIKGAGYSKLPVEVDGLPSNIELISVNPSLVTVNVDKVVSRRFDVELSESGKPKDGFTLRDYKLNPSRVLVRGPEKLMNTVDKAVIDVNTNNLDKDMDGRFKVNLLDPSGKPVSGLAVKPRKLYASFNVSSAKSVPVKLVTRGTPAAGYKLYNEDVLPASVKIMGDKEVLESIDEIRTQPLNLSGLTSGISYNVKLDIPRGVTVKDDQNEVKVNIAVDKTDQLTDKELNVDKLTVTGPDPQNINYEFTSAKVVLTGRAGILDNLNKDDITLKITVPSQPGTYNVEIKGTISSLHDNATIKLIEPSSISVQVMENSQ